VASQRSSPDVRDAALSFGGLVFNPLRKSFITGRDSAYLISDVRVMYAVSAGKDLFGERPPATC
jgi:hypothetical protein